MRSRLHAQFMECLPFVMPSDAAWGLDEMVGDLARAREGLLAAVAPLDQAALDRRGGSGWSPGMVLDHLVRSEAGAVKVIAKLVREAPVTDPIALPDQRHRLDFAHLDDRTQTNEAPAVTLPTASRLRDDLLRDLARSRIALLDLVRKMRPLDLRDRTVPHPILGPLDAYQWLLFVAQHEARHTQQILEAT